MWVGGVFVVVWSQLAIFSGSLVVGAVADGLQHLDHAPHGRAVDRERAGAEEADVENSAYFVLETRIEPRVDHVLHALLVDRRAHPFHQILLPELWVYRMFSGDQLQNHHPETVRVALLVHSKRVAVFCNEMPKWSSLL